MNKKKQLTKFFICLLLIGVIITACGNKKKNYVIGISQCSTDIWREKLNDELMTGAYLYDNVNLHFASAYDSDERQVEQIDSLLKLGIDLLIVAPNQIQAVSPAIDKAFDKGIPVIVFDRKTNSEKYTAYIGADNYDMGYRMGEYIGRKLNGQGRVMEIMGLKGSSPAIDRHKGFSDALKLFPGIEAVATLQGDWTKNSGEEAVKAFRGDLTKIDYVFGQNDRMAMGARQAFAAQNIPLEPDHSPLFCGIDGLPGTDCGIQQVCDSLLDATSIYPTRGDMVMQLALNILEGKPYNHENPMKSAIVTRANAEVMLMQAEEIGVQADQLEVLHKQVDKYLAQYRHQRVYMVLLGTIILLLLIIAWYVIHTMHRRHQLEREAFALVVGEITSVPEATTETEQTTEEPPTTSPVSIQEKETEESPFLEQLRKIVQDGLTDNDFSVETLADKMNLSRVQLYRKVKLLTGKTPVDIIRRSRLNHARVLLQTTDKTISEVAYEVGFSAPSYFTKCFKDEFGYSPSDM